MGARDYRRSPVIRIIARFQLTTATNQKFRNTTVRGRRILSAIETSTTANSFEISRAASGPAPMSRPMNVLLSPAPICNPIQVVAMSST